jgi:hypothetical protein
MPDLTAKRTLVKSPPELWEELSEVERLAKHLGAFGEITITKLEPEHTVAWEGEHASGTVSIEPSGWGTKVTLRAELPEPEPEPEPEPDPEPAAAAPPEEAQHIAGPSVPFRVEPEPEAEPDPIAAAPIEEAQHIGDTSGRFRVEPAVEPDEEVGEEASGEVPEEVARRGFWGWLFRRRTEAVAEPTTEAEPAAAGPRPIATDAESEPIAAEGKPVIAEPEPAEPEPIAAEAHAEPVVEPPADPEPVAAEAEPEPAEAEPIAAEARSEPVVEPPGEPEPIVPEDQRVAEDEPEPESIEAGPQPAADSALDPERARVILDEALDTLGAAHHRPFSRG